MVDSRYTRISRKWVGFVTAIWVQSIAGNNYTFANYSQELKSVMHYNQVQLNNLGVAKDVGKSFGLFAGLLADRLPTWLILLIGAVEGAVGYGTQYLVVSQTIRPPSYWQMCVVLCMGGNSTTWMNTAVLVTCMRNFPRSRGTVTGTLKGYIGLSTAIFTQLCTALFTSEASSFLLLLTILPAIVCCSAIIFLTEVPASASHDEDVEEQAGFTIINWISLALALYLLTFTVLEFFFPLSSLQFKLFAVVLLLFLIAPLVVPLKLILRIYNDDKSSPVSPDATAITKPLLEETSDNVVPQTDASQGVLTQVEKGSRADSKLDATTADDREVSKSVEEYKFPSLGEDHNLTEALLTIEFWLLFFTFLCGIGTGITAINNLGQIGEAQGFADVSIFISLISIWGFFGRVGAGAVSEYYVKKAAIPRPLWMAISQIFLLMGYIMFAMAAPGSLYMGSIVVGICYGVHISITVPTASELFGLKHFGMLYNFLILNIPLGSFLFSGMLAGWLYDREASKVPHLSTILVKKIFSTAADFVALGESVDPPKCVGSHCFRSVFIVMAGMCAFGILLNVVLILRIRPLYQDLYGPNGSVERKRRMQPKSR